MQVYCRITIPALPQKYIMAQGPLDNTVEDFVHMIWSENVQVIVALTKETENDEVKCHRYWPKHTGEKLTFGEYVVTMPKTANMPHAGFMVRELKVQYNNDAHMVLQIHYLGWPDKGVPASAEEFSKLVELVAENQKPGKSLRTFSLK